MPLPLEEEFDDLLAPIPGPNPAGEPLSFVFREQLDEARKEVNPDDYAENDPARPELKRADWAGLIRLCSTNLKRKSKDLTLTVRLLEALVKEHGFPGAVVGFRLARRLLEDCWDRLLPVIEDGDLEPRAGIFFWIDDPVRGGRFPTTLRRVPIAIRGESQLLHTLDWEKAREGSGRLNVAEYEKAIQTTPREFYRGMLGQLTAAREEVRLLYDALHLRMGDLAPGCLEIGKALDSCTLIVSQIFERKGIPKEEVETTAPDAPPEPDAPLAAAPDSPSRPIAKASSPEATDSREDIYATIAAGAAKLQKLEPHSPIPMLIRIAVDMAALPFPQLMGALARDRLMGALIRDPEILQCLVQELTGIQPR